MKISKKIMTMLLCGFMTISGSQLLLVKANAETSSASNQNKWEQPIRLKLRAKWNELYKSYWTINLVCKNNGELKLEGPTNVPSNLTFDDFIVMGLEDTRFIPGRSLPCLSFEVQPSRYGSAEVDLRDAMAMFNEEAPREGDVFYAHGFNWGGTLTFPNNKQRSTVIHQYTKNDYTKGYKTKGIDRWKSAFEIKSDGLHECLWDHSKVKTFPIL